MKIIFLFILICMSAFAYGQQPHTPLSPKEFDDSVKCERLFEWEKSIEYIDFEYVRNTPLRELETDRDTVLILEFIINCRELQETLPYYEGYPESFISTICAIDFNGDSAKDFLYFGPSGGEPPITKIFINKGNHFKEVFSGLQVITEYKFTKNRLTSFTLYNPGCCADPQDLNLYYSVKYNGNQPTFVRLKTIGNLFRTQKPDTLAEDNLSFSVATDSAALRNECYILDEIPCSPGNYSGTALAYYKKGSTGYLLGTRNEGGVEWVYVIMDVNPGKKHCFYPSFTEQPTQIKGWMLKSDTDLK